MKYTKFIIKKFKWIDELELDLSKTTNWKIFPLVGLNEAGKTTILEAINFFQNWVEEWKEHELIHKRDKWHFTGEISVTAMLKLDNEDKQFIRSYLEENNLQLEKDIEEISITKIFEYKNWLFIEKKPVLWWFTPSLKIKANRARVYKDLYKEYQNLWKELVDKIEKKYLPKILYFENFIFKFPEKIFLEDIPNPTQSGEDLERQKRYRQVIEDILKTCNTSYKRTDLISKLKSSNQGDEDSGKQILREMEIKLNEKILDHWNAIFPDSPRKTISIEYGNESNGLYLQIKISEGSSTFYVDERSLGFRWFFGFILFTEFRKAREGENWEYLFLFDEPANNLHEGSQRKLLTLFDSIINKAKIIYSTHSPYILKPEYLLTSFIVKDKWRNVDNEYNYRQNVMAIPYRQFVANYPKEETHYKPLLDVLEFHAHDFEFVDPIVFTEWKNDYYTFKWIYNTYFLGNQDYKFKFYPWASVDKYDNIFREYLAHNKSFVAIFDADKGGKDAKKRYINNISQELEKNIFTLKDIDNNFDSFTTEKLFTENDRLKIQQNSFPETNKYAKKKFNSAIQELFIDKEPIDLEEKTINNFKKVFNFIKIKLDGENN